MPDVFLIRRRTRPGPARAARSKVRHCAWRGKWYLTLRGQYRIFGAAVYRFYRSNSGPPAETDSPFATSATLPHEPANTYADGTWYLSASYFNGCIDSGFLPLGPAGETYLRLDLSGGEQEHSPPGGPLDWRIENVGGGVVRVLGLYFQSDALRAEQWAIAYTTNGEDPPADAPDVTASMTAGGLVVLSYDLPAQANGTTVKVRLQTRRQEEDESWTYSEDSTIKTITADALGPAAPEAGATWPGVGTMN